MSTISSYDEALDFYPEAKRGCRRRQIFHRQPAYRVGVHSRRPCRRVPLPPVGRTRQVG